MKIEIGDKVRFLNEVGGGVVSRIVSDRLVHVLDEDGFEIPVLLTEVVLVEKNKVNDKGVEENKRAPVEDEDYTYEESMDEGDPKVMLSFIRLEDNSNKLKMYMINDSNFHVFYTVGEVNDELVSFMFAGSIEPNTKIELFESDVHYFSEKELDLQLLLYRKSFSYSSKAPVSKRIKLSGVKLVRAGSYVDNDFFEQKAYSVFIIKSAFENKLEQLSEKQLYQVLKEKEKKEPVKIAKKNRDTEIHEVDLHIHELIDDTRGLSNKEILDIQMEKFHKVMNENKGNKNKKIVFIHGVGNGVLKSEIRKALERKYKWHSFQDASFQEYGFGATMVVI